MLNEVKAPCDFSLFLKLKLQLKGCRFDTIEVIQTKSQAVLDTLTKADTPKIFKERNKYWDWCIRVGGNYFEGDSICELLDSTSYIHSVLDG